MHSCNTYTKKLYGNVPKCLIKTIMKSGLVFDDIIGSTVSFNKDGETYMSKVINISQCGKKYLVSEIPKFNSIHFPYKEHYIEKELLKQISDVQDMNIVYGYYANKIDDNGKKIYQLLRQYLGYSDL